MDTFASPIPKRFLGMVSDWPELPIGQVSLIPLPPPGGLAHPGTNHRDHRDHSTFGPRPDFFGVERPTGQAVGREITAITGITALFETGLQFWGGQGPEGWGGRKSHRPGQFQPVGSWPARVLAGCSLTEKGQVFLVGMFYLIPYIHQIAVIQE